MSYQRDSPQPNVHQHLKNRHLCEPCFDATASAQESVCPDCGIRTKKLLRHRGSKACIAYAGKRNLTQRLEEATEAIPTIRLDGEPVEVVTQFRYLGRIVTSEGSDEHAITCNRMMARRKLAAIQPLLRSHKLPVRVRLRITNTIVLTTLLYGCETWALTPALTSMLQSEQQRILRVASGKHSRKVDDHRTAFPSRLVVLRAAKAESVDQTVRRRRMLFAGDIVRRSCATWANTILRFVRSDKSPSLREANSDDLGPER